MSYKLDTNSELNDKQKDSVFILTALGDKNDLPERFKDSSQSTKVNSEHKIQLSVEFYNWLDDVEKRMEFIDESSVNNEFIVEMNAKKSVCIGMHQEVQGCLDRLSKLKELYLNTSNKTNALHEACESLLKDQMNYAEKAKGLEERLRYFLIVDHLSMKISFPNLKISVENIKPILDQIDESYKFLSKNLHYLESGGYMTKLEDLLWAILNKIYSYFSQEINNTFSQFSNKEEISQEKSFTILYGRFRTQATKIRPFIELISSRKDLWDVYLQTAEKCERFFLEKREQLLQRVISGSIDDLVARFPRDHCAFIRSGGALMIRLCDDEQNLYQQFFVHSNLELLRNMLTRLCCILYEAFRPSIIHINHLETLAELCCILKMELAEDYANKTDADESPIDRMCQMIIEDVQERLVFRTHIYIKSQILGYTPSSGDLAYPEKLHMMISIAESMRQQPAQDQPPQLLPGNGSGIPDNGADLVVMPGPNMSLSPADLHGMWYPTVRRTLVCLSKLRRCLDITTFQGLAQDCVAQCVQSLVLAGTAIEKSRTTTDAQLFLIKHLLILREQVAPFNVEFTVKETSLTFTNIKNAAVGLITSRSQILALNRSNSLIRFLLETPNIIETVVDSRHQLDGQLKSICDHFIADSVQALVGSILDFLAKVSSLEQLSQDSRMPVRLQDQPFAEVTHLQELVVRCGREFSTCTVPSRGGRLVHLRRSLHLYLTNPDTETILLKPIKAAVIRAYRALNQILADNYSQEDCHIVACPSEKQISLKMEISMDSSTQ